MICIADDLAEPTPSISRQEVSQAEAEPAPATVSKKRGFSPIFRAACVLAAIIFFPHAALADSGGVSFWLPGQFGSLAAVPPTPGWSLETIYYDTSVSAGGDVAAARAIRVGTLTGIENANLSGNLHSPSDLLYLTPSYGFATPVFGGQAALSVGGAYGRTSTALNATLTGIAPLSFTRSESTRNSLAGFGDLSPQFSVAWSSGR